MQYDCACVLNVHVFDVMQVANCIMYKIWAVIGSIYPEETCHTLLTSPPLTSPHLPPPRPTSPHLSSPPLTSPHLPSPPLTSPHPTSPHIPSPPLTFPHLPLPPLIPPPLTSPHLSSPPLTSPYPTSPPLTSPYLTSPPLPSPLLTSPHLTSPHLTSPHLTSPHLTSPLFLSAGSVAEDNSVPYYAEKCTAMFGVTYSSGNNGMRRITTTDVTWRSEGCSTGRTGLTGTSASAPMAAGMIALMLDARWVW